MKRDLITIIKIICSFRKLIASFTEPVSAKLFSVDISGESVTIQYEMIDDHEQIIMDFLIENSCFKVFSEKNLVFFFLFLV